jgi:dTDP-4-dehydrorhamnose reductase
METGTHTVMLSSNMVYDGSMSLVASDVPRSPVTEYGRQKAELEGILLSDPQKAAVLRLTKVLHRDLPLLNRWTADITAGKSIEAFADYFCSPILLSTVLRGLLRIINQGMGGVWQFSAPDQVSYAEIARHLAISLRASQSLVRESACGTSVEHVPCHTTLDVSRASAELGLDFDPATVTLTKLFAR